MASGSGTNAENLLSYAQIKKTYNVACVITDKVDAGVITRCEKYSVDCYVVPYEKSKELSHLEAKTIHESKILNILESNKIEWVFLAGYMRILSADFISKYWDEQKEKSKIINIHPALLPSFPGKDAYEQAWDSGVEQSGVTVHHVDSGIDTGPIIIQESFQRKKEDNLQSFKARGLEVEYKLYKKAIDQLFAT
tara:strand:- start:6410 stop:6991 length:582 start_codon:yes stop_codon:yes gene_type:complete